MVDYTTYCEAAGSSETLVHVSATLHGVTRHKAVIFIDSYQTLKSRTNCMLRVFDTALNTSDVQKYDTFQLVDWATQVRNDVQNRNV